MVACLASGMQTQGCGHQESLIPFAPEIMEENVFDCEYVSIDIIGIV